VWNVAVRAESVHVDHMGRVAQFGRAPNEPLVVRHDAGRMREVVGSSPIPAPSPYIISYDTRVR